MKRTNSLSKELRTLIFNGEPKRKKEGVETIFARVFLSEDGKKILSHLQSLTMERTLGADASDASLRYIEGQRSMLSMIFRLIDQGRNK